MVNGPVDLKMAHASHPVVEIVSAGAPKRRRSNADEGRSGLLEEGAPDAKRRKSNSSTPEPTSEIPGEAGVNAAEMLQASKPSRIRDAIESQFSLEILLKHKELQLINQELAKCQAALEQLRRCHLIPFPPSVTSPLSMENVSNGTGPAVGHRDRVPKWAPPFGVTDGPYSRHYTKWLISDPKFDGVEAESSEGSRAGKTVPEGRSTRNSFTESMPASKSRSQRGSMGQKLQALSSGYPPVKEKAGPCVLKRGDGQWVKLICIDCNRHDFSSTQGFINHCRISHRRDFKSHEEAAVACGHPAEFDEFGRIVGEEKTPAIVPGVHPLIRTAPHDKEAYAALLSRIQSSMDMFMNGNLPGVTSIPAATTALPTISTVPANKNFVPSSTTPHLSALMASRGFGGNLSDLVGEAQTKATFDDEEESEDGEDEVNVGKHPLAQLDGSASPPPPMRMPARAVASPAPQGRPSSSKSIEARHGRQLGLSGNSPRLAHATPVINTSGRPLSRLGNIQDAADNHHATDIDIEMIDHHSMIDLSPNTVASNNAPSLVSDDGEYDEGDDAESAHSEGESEHSDVAEINIDDDSVEKVIPRTVMRNRSGSGSDSLRLRKEDKHVQFVSPVKDASRNKGARQL